MKNMRKHILLVMALFSGVLLGACSFEQEDLFDEGAAQRIVHFNDNLAERLVAQSSNGNHGWIIQYFVAGTDVADFEGFVLLGSFEKSGKVTLASNHRYLRNGNAGKYTEAVSYYQMLREEGPVLAFNTWNDVLTVFADPMDPSAAPGNVVSDGEGMNGDQNLVFTGYDGDHILFRGERHSAEVRFIPCDRPWQQYLADVADAKKRITSSTLNQYYVTDGKDTMYIDGLNNGVFVYEDRLVDPLQATKLSCVFSTDGMRLNRAVPFGDISFKNFTVSPDKTRLLSDDGKIQIIAMWDKYIAESTKSLYRIDEASFTPEQASLYTQMQAEVKKVNVSYELDSLTVGRISETQDDGSNVFMPGLIACVHGPKKMGRTPQYYPYVNMNIDMPEFGIIRFGQSSVDRSNTYMTMFDGTNLKSLCQQFVASLYGTYQMVPNDYFRPTSVTLKPKAGGNDVVLQLAVIKD